MALGLQEGWKAEEIPSFLCFFALYCLLFFIIYSITSFSSYFEGKEAACSQQPDAPVAHIERNRLRALSSFSSPFVVFELKLRYFLLLLFAIQFILEEEEHLHAAAPPKYARVGKLTTAVFHEVKLHIHLKFFIHFLLLRRPFCRCLAAIAIRGFAWVRLLSFLEEKTEAVVYIHRI